MARAALRDDLHTVHAQLVAEVLTTAGGRARSGERPGPAWEKATPAVDGLDQDAALDLRGKPDLARVSVGSDSPGAAPAALAWLGAAPLTSRAGC